MRNILWLFFSPFATIGGIIVGWVGHRVYLAQFGADSIPFSVMTDSLLALMGVILILLGGLIRHWMVADLKKRVSKQSNELENKETARAWLQQGKDKAERRLQVVRELLGSLDQTQKEFILSVDDEQTKGMS